MRQLSDKDKEMFKALAQSNYGQFLREYCAELLSDLGDISTVKQDPIESRKNALEIINNKLVVHLQEVKPEVRVEPDNYN